MRQYKVTCNPRVNYPGYGANGKYYFSGVTHILNEDEFYGEVVDYAMFDIEEIIVPLDPPAPMYQDVTQPAQDAQTDAPAAEADTEQEDVLPTQIIVRGEKEAKIAREIIKSTHKGKRKGGT